MLPSEPVKATMPSTNDLPNNLSRASMSYSSIVTSTSDDGESEKQRLDRLGRQRPAQLPTLRHEIAFVLAVIMSQALAEFAISGFTVLVPFVTSALDIPPAGTTWPASAFSLVVAAFLLPFGRVADLYGGYPVYLAGTAWSALWFLIGGFARDPLMLDLCRALQGLGPAASLPAGLTLLGAMYRPGPRKNLVFSVYGAMAPGGFYLGIFAAGAAVEYAGSWRWYFWIGAIVTVFVLGLAVFAIPDDRAAHRGNGVKMDWWGSVTIVAGLILVVFAITDASGAPQGWATPYIIATLVLGVAMLGLAFYIEGWVAEQPILPFEIFKIPYMKPFTLALLLSYGTVGIFVLYASLYCANILGATPMQLVAWYTPMAVGGVILATCGGLLLHIVPAKILMILTGLAIITDALLFALAPAGANYWAWIFPAMLAATVAIDLIFNVANIFLSTQLPARQQGLAGALSNFLLQLSVAVLLAGAEVVVHATTHSAQEDAGGADGIDVNKQIQRKGYQNAFWFELACGAAGLVVFVCFVRIRKAEGELTADEKEEAARVQMQVQREKEEAATAIREQQQEQQQQEQQQQEQQQQEQQQNERETSVDVDATSAETDAGSVRPATTITRTGRDEA